MNEEQIEHVEKLAKIEARRIAFESSPAWFTVWDTLRTILEAICYMAVFALLAQCSCHGCIWHDAP